MAGKTARHENMAEPIGRYAEEALLRANDSLGDACEAIRDAKPEDAQKHAEDAKAWIDSVERLASESNVEIDEQTSERMADANQRIADIAAITSAGSAA